jgi:hypothetical protein
MKKLLSWAVTAAVVLWMSGITAGAAPLGMAGQGKSTGHAQGKSTKADAQKAESENKGKKPEEKGVAHADDVANEQGVTHGITKAETEQAEKDASVKGEGKGHKGKKLAKGKAKDKGKSEAKGEHGKPE